MHLFHSMDFHGTLHDTDEGTLEWLDKKALLALPDLWSGDRIFLQLMEEGAPFFSLKLCYRGDTLTGAELNGRAIAV